MIGFENFLLINIVDIHRNDKREEQLIKYNNNPSLWSLLIIYCLRFNWLLGFFSLTSHYELLEYVNPCMVIISGSLNENEISLSM